MSKQSYATLSYPEKFLRGPIVSMQVGQSSGVTLKKIYLFIIIPILLFRLDIFYKPAGDMHQNT